MGWERSCTRTQASCDVRVGGGYSPFFSPFGVVFTKGASSCLSSFSFLAFFSPAGAVVAALAALDALAALRASASFCFASFFSVQGSDSIACGEEGTDLRFWSRAWQHPQRGSPESPEWMLRTWRRQRDGEDVEEDDGESGEGRIDAQSAFRFCA